MLPKIISSATVPYAGDSNQARKIITSSLLQVWPVTTEILSCQTQFPLQPQPRKPPSEMVHPIAACASCEAAPGQRFAQVNDGALKQVTPERQIHIFTGNLTSVQWSNPYGLVAYWDS